MRILLNLLLVLLLVLTASVGALVFGWQPEPFPPQSASSDRLQPGPLSVARYDTVFEDHSRATSANKDYPGADSRRLEATVWHPAASDAGPYPLLVYSHGYSSSRRGGAYLAEHMASLGYVVVAIDFPLTNMYAPGGPRVRDVVNQPADVRYVIDRVLDDAATPDHALAGEVDPGRIGVFGLSLGGLTTELVAFHPEMRDPRIGAALSIAGPTSMLAPAFFQQRAGLPFLMLAGDIDALVPWESNAAPIPDKLPGAELVTVRGASHTGFAGPAAWMRWMDNPDALGCYIVTRNIGRDMDEPWFELIGSPEQGVIANGENELCRVDPLPEAMNVLRQQMITRVVVSSFFDHHFAQTQERRAEARAYLRQQMAEELPEVEYAVNPSRVAAASAR